MAESQPCSQVQLTISAKNLKDKDILSKSDPMCVVSIRESANQSFTEIGRTECVMNCLNPEFAKKIQLKYKFERLQTLLFEVYDIDDNSYDVRNHDFLGRWEIALAEIVAAPNGTLTRSLKGLKGNCGTITVVAEELNGTAEVLTLICRGETLDKKDWFGKSDPFLNFYRVNADGSLYLAHRTEVIKNNLNPIWAPFKIPMLQLALDGDRDTPFIIRCFDYDNDGGHDLIGDCQTTANKLVHGAQKIPLIHPKKQQKKKSYQNSGYLLFTNCRVHTQYTFFDYISTGTQLHFAVAIDFTQSNGIPTHPNSLHNVTSGRMNQYQMALQSVGRILEFYNKTQQYLSFGFGAKVPNCNYNVTMNPAQPYCCGVNEILAAYAQAIHTVQLYGPTNFSPVINRMATHASQYQNGKNYFILLIVTDGIITDVEATKKAVVNASCLPMSIIIVGVGDADFTQMEILDSDNEKLRAGNQIAERDIVQFVPFNEVRKSGGQSTLEWEELLAEKVMEEVPYQVAEWMNARGMRPGMNVNGQPGKTTAVPGAPPLPIAIGDAPPPYDSLKR